MRAVAIGASAGGIELLEGLLKALPRALRLSLLVVQHVHPTERGYLAELLAAHAAVPVTEAEDKQAIAPGHVYVAPANYHLLVERDETLALSTDQKVNYSRPSIDVLFESAAYALGPRLVGVLLTGANNDGAAGLALIAHHGGFVVVQDPKTAAHPVMPEAGLAAVTPHRVVSPAELPELVTAIDGLTGARA
jgi:two-component system chemotaxis response regulator CheB